MALLRCLAAAVVALPLGFAAAVQAAPALNGLPFNGIYLNGIYLNGIHLNGFELTEVGEKGLQPSDASSFPAESREASCNALAALARHALAADVERVSVARDPASCGAAGEPIR